MTDSVELESKDIVKDNIEQLKQIFPDIVKDGKIDFDTLKLILGEEVEKGRENYKFEWSGKTNCYKTIQSPSLGTLKPQKEESIDFNNSENLVIEGDNLEVLKLLQSTYGKNGGQIKIIYIDPPYNTGKDFVYPDNFNTPLDNYLELTGQTENGETTQSNKSQDGRKHTQWLNMIFPRLLLSRTLLKEDGVIFISIDDNEVDNMKKLCDEVFGEENFIGQLVWRKKYTGGKHSKHYVDLHEYILVYSKNITLVEDFFIDRNDNEKVKFKEDDEFIKTRGKFYTRPLKSNLEERKTLIYPIHLPDGKSITTQWLMGEERFKKELSEKRVMFKKKQNGEYQVYKKYYELDGNGQTKPPTLILDYPNTEGKTTLKKIFNIKEGRDNVFYTVKPVELIKHLLKPVIGKNDIVLDFFGGSGTTGQSVLELNKEDNGNRKFILVQLPEKTNNPEYPTIFDITKERIRRVINGYGDNPQPINDGFKVFKLDKSNYIINEKLSVNPQINKEDLIIKLRQSLLKEDHLIHNYNPIDVVYEVILKEGYSLNSMIKELNINSTNIYKVVDGNKLCYITFGNVDIDIIKDKEFIGISKDTLLVCLDKNLSDSDKDNLSLTFQLKTI